MNGDSIAVKCAIVRGGTSKAIFVMDNELPKDAESRKKVILGLYGSPDVRQIDGLGGADLLTSKLAIIGPPSRPDADVDYTFGQVSLKEAHVEFNSNCGNIASGVGPFAIDMGLVRPVEPITTVRIHVTNLGKVMTAQIPVKDGKACEMIGMVDDWRRAKEETYYLPFLVMVTKAQDYECFTGAQVRQSEIDIVGRMSTMGMINKTFAGSGTVCTGAAARIKGSVVWEMLGEEARARDLLYIGHCAGRIPVESAAKETADGKFQMEKINIFRTARIIMEGQCFVRKSCLR